MFHSLTRASDLSGIFPVIQTTGDASWGYALRAEAISAR
jgi:hypothetical protein